jgi:hypothetical protein
MGFITSTSHEFTAEDIGKAIILNDISGVNHRTFYVEGFVNQNKIDVKTEVNSQNLEASQWYLARNKIYGIPNYYNDNEWDICIDGIYEGKFTVENNSIQLESGRYASVVCIGVNYEARLKTLNLGYIAGMSNSQVLKKNINKAIFRVYNSYGGKFGTSLDSLQDIYDTKSIDVLMDKVPILKNEDLQLKVVDVWSEEKKYYIVQEKPMPLNVTMVTLEQDFMN